MQISAWQKQMLRPAFFTVFRDAFARLPVRLWPYVGCFVQAIMHISYLLDSGKNLRCNPHTLQGEA